MRGGGGAWMMENVQCVIRLKCKTGYERESQVKLKKCFIGPLIDPHVWCDGDYKGHQAKSSPQLLGTDSALPYPGVGFYMDLSHDALPWCLVATYPTILSAWLVCCVMTKMLPEQGRQGLIKAASHVCLRY